MGGDLEPVLVGSRREVAPAIEEDGDLEAVLAGVWREAPATEVDSDLEAALGGTRFPVLALVPATSVDLGSQDVREF